MNTLFGDMAERLTAFDPYTEAIIAAKPAEKDIIAENQSMLHDSGLRTNETKLGPYAKSTAKRKKLDGERYDHITLKETGDFYDSMKVRFGQRSFRVTADDKKINDDGSTTFLTEQWGDEILGLRDSVLDFIIENTIKPNMQAALRAKMQL